MADRRQIAISFDSSDGLCFGCGQNNPIGLKLDFKWDSRTARAEFTPDGFHQGWPGIVHGGIIAAMLDEAMGQAILFSGLNCVTAQMQVNYKQPILTGDKLVITGSISKNNRRLVEAEAKVSLPDSTVMAEGSAIFVNMEHPDISKEKKQENG